MQIYYKFSGYILVYTLPYLRTVHQPGKS